jgi:tetratricopeptide (TPR) repeat protein
MKPKKKVEEALRTKLRFTAGPAWHDQMLADVLHAQEDCTLTSAAHFEPVPRRIIMKGTLTKLLSAAAVIAVAVLSVTLWVKFSPPAYAVSQTVEAIKNARFVHIIGRDEKGQVNDERWVEIGMDGHQLRYRQQHPLSLLLQFQQTREIPRETTGDRTMVPMAINDGKATALYRYDKLAVIIYDRKDRQYTWVSNLGGALENLRQEGKILEENADYGGGRAHKVWWPALSTECYVDPETKLPIAMNGATLSYGEPPAGTFEIVIPDGYAVLDKRPGAPATAAPDWLMQEENTQEHKMECFRRGAEALARGDSAEAAQQFEQAVGVDSWAWFWLGKAYYELGRYDLAIKNFDTLLEVYKKVEGSDTLPYCNYARGLAYARLGMQEQAKADLQACLPAMIQTLRIPSGGYMFEYADNPMVRYGKYHPSEQETVVKMVNRLRLITGQSFGYDPAGTPEQKEAAVAAWEQWFHNGGQTRFTPDAELLAVPPAENP